MIPYFQIAPFHIFNFTIHAFEILTALGIFLGIRRALIMANARNLPEKSMLDAMFVSIVMGFIGAHLVHVVMYERDYSQLFNFSKGISSTGGFLVGGFACWTYLKIKKMPIMDFGDCLIPSVLTGLLLGRIGCFTAHDHPGAFTSMPWGVMFPDGVRHDLGFEEAILVGVFLILVWIKPIKQWLDGASGRWMIAGMFYYGFVRFFLDFLRAQDVAQADPRYFGLTPAQYICLLFIFMGFFWFRKYRPT